MGSLNAKGQTNSLSLIFTWYQIH